MTRTYTIPRRTFVLRCRLLVRLILSIAVISWSGCSPGPKPVDPTTLVLVPGVGISNVVELGMTTKQVKEKVPGVKVLPVGVEDYSFSVLGRSIQVPRPLSKPWRYDCSIPALGIGWTQTEEDEPIKEIMVSVVTDPRLYVKGESVFLGKLGDAHSFTVGTKMSAEDIVNHFGEPSHNFTTYNAVMLQQAEDLVQAGQSVHTRWSNTSEWYIYPVQGISFALESNVVHLITVTNPVPAKPWTSEE